MSRSLAVDLQAILYLSLIHIRGLMNIDLYTKSFTKVSQKYG